MTAKQENAYLKKKYIGHTFAKQKFHTIYVQYQCELSERTVTMIALKAYLWKTFNFDYIDYYANRSDSLFFFFFF